MASSLVTPYLIYQPFGANAANPTYITLPIPQPSQIGTTVNAASFYDGFPPSTMTPEASGGLPFFGQEMNGILWMVSAYCANFAAGALSQYNATLSSNVSGYPVGVVLVNASGSGAWINQVSGNTTDPDTGGAGWLPTAGVGETAITGLSSSNVTLTALQAARPYIGLAGTLTANINIIFPANAGQQWVVANECTGSFTVTCKTASGSGVIVPATGPSAPTSIYCDNTNIQNTGVSTAGLAPIASPALTGTPTAPTASASTSTTQIATTAMVQAAITAALSPYATKASPVLSGVPQTPTAAPGTNNAQIASTAFVTAAIAANVAPYRAGTFNCSNGTVSVAFSSVLPFVPIVTVTWNYATPDVGFIVPGSITTSGFQYTNGNAGLCNYIAVQEV
jgi:hypothetical protein